MKKARVRSHARSAAVWDAATASEIAVLRGATQSAAVFSSIEGFDLLPTAAAAATLLRLTLAAFWIVHWWFKVGFRGMPATVSFFGQNDLPAWLAWFDISFEVVVTACLILGLYVPLICVISLPILVASMIIYRGNGFYFPAGGIEFPILWALVQIVLALLGPGRWRMKPAAWLPRIPGVPGLAP